MTTRRLGFPLLLAAAFLLTGAAQAKKHINPAGAPLDGTATPLPAGPPPTPDSPTGDKTTPTPPVLPDETAYVLMDGTTGAILAQAAPNLQVAPASLTKLMTAHLAFQALHGGSLKPDQTVPVSVEAWHAGGSTMFIDPKSTVTVDQLLHGLIIVSGNDAAIALAEQIAGSQDSFVQMMNKQAATLGLANTVYTNVNGLPDPAEHTTALDVATLTRNILLDEPEILQISKQQSYTYDNITQGTWNPVLAHDSTVDGLKTGLTKESGHCIDATAMRNNIRLIAVVMGGPTWHDSTAAIESLLNYGEKFFTDVHLATPGVVLDTIQNEGLESGSVTVGAARDAVITLPADAAKTVTHSIVYNVDLVPGVTAGQTLGTITYSAGGATLATIPAVALQASPAADYITKLKRRLHKLL